MSLTVEDGTGLAAANCYISEAEIDAYALLRNIDLSAYSTAQKEAGALLRFACARERRSGDE